MEIIYGDKKQRTKKLSLPGLKNMHKYIYSNRLFVNKKGFAFQLRIDSILKLRANKIFIKK